MPISAPDEIITRAPSPPDHLTNDIARKLWKDTCRVMISRSLLTVDHLPLVMGYCNSFSMYLQAEAMIAKEGITAPTADGIKKHPAVAVRQDALSSLARLGSLLGLDPTSYRRLMGGGGGSPDGENEFEIF